MAREIFVVVGALGKVDPLGGLLVALQQGGDVVNALFLVLREDVENKPGKAALVAARLGKHRHVGRRDAQGSARGLIIGVPRREMIRRSTWSLEHFALVVGTIGHFIVGRDGGDLRGRKARTCRIAKVAERYQLQAVTIATHLAIDLKAALQLPAVVNPERARKRPGLSRGDRVLGARRRQHEAPKARSSHGDCQRLAPPSTHVRLHAPPQPRRSGAAAPLATGAPPLGPSTASVIDVGSGRGRSHNPSAGKMIRKWKKYQAVRTRAHST